MFACRVLNFDGREFAMKYADLMPPMSEEQRRDLREDILKRGVVTPVVRTKSGVLIDGNNRAEICFELGLGLVPYIEIDDFSTEEEERAMAIALNLHRRHMTREQRAEWCQKLRAEGWSTIKIAEAVGTSKDTVRRDLEECATCADEQVAHLDRATSANAQVAHTEPEAPSLPEKVTGRDGIERPAEKPSVDELAERRAKAAELKEAGKTRKEIASDLGVSVRTVAADLSKACQVDNSGSSSHSWPTPHPEDWDKSWTNKLRGYVVKVGAELAVYNIAGESKHPADGYRKIRWDICPTLAALVDAEDSFRGVIDDLQSHLDSLRQEIDQRRKLDRPALRVVGVRNHD